MHMSAKCLKIETNYFKKIAFRKENYIQRCLLILLSRRHFPLPVRTISRPGFVNFSHFLRIEVHVREKCSKIHRRLIFSNSSFGSKARHYIMSSTTEYNSFSSTRRETVILQEVFIDFLVNFFKQWCPYLGNTGHHLRKQIFNHLFCKNRANGSDACSFLVWIKTFSINVQKITSTTVFIEFGRLFYEFPYTCCKTLLIWLPKGILKVFRFF